jgi:hypothetical protein
VTPARPNAGSGTASGNSVQMNQLEALRGAPIAGQGTLALVTEDAGRGDPAPRPLAPSPPEGARSVSAWVHVKVHRTGQTQPQDGARSKQHEREPQVGGLAGIQIANLNVSCR